MNSEETEMQLWEYIDGTCSVAEKERIGQLIAADAEWRAKYEELTMLHATIAGSMETEQPSMRFTRNVMDTIATTHVSTAAGKYINKSIIMGIAAFFIITIAAGVGYVFVATDYTANSSLLPKLNLNQLNGMMTSTVFNVVIGINIILALALVDTMLRRKRLSQ